MLRLRPLRIEDERAALAAHAALKAEGHEMLLDYRRDDNFARYLARREANRLGHMLPPRWVSSTLLVAEVDGVLVGRTSIRHELNDWLAKYGGHIGYAVVPEQRRKGYATEILRQALVVAHSIGIDDVLVTCDDTNVASARVIEKCGGEFDSLARGDGLLRRRYWFH